MAKMATYQRVSRTPIDKRFMASFLFGWRIPHPAQSVSIFRRFQCPPSCEAYAYIRPMYFRRPPASFPTPTRQACGEVPLSPPDTSDTPVAHILFGLASNDWFL